MVIAAIACDTRARLAPVCGLSPYADEIITVLSPNGIAFAQSAAKTISLSVFKSLNAVTKIVGKTISLSTATI